MSEESGRCPICGEYLDHYGRSVLCYNPKCPLYLEAGPLVALIGALVDLVQDRPRPIETAPKDRPFYAHTRDGQKLLLKYKHPMENLPEGYEDVAEAIGDWYSWKAVLGATHYGMDICALTLNMGFTGWTPVEEGKP